MQQPIGESPLVIIQTRAPVEIIRYLKGLAMLKYGKLLVMNEEMVKQFIMYQPWAAERPLNWRHPKSRDEKGWDTFNLQMSHELKEEVRRLCITLDVSMSVFAYTVIFWWVAYMNPPSQQKISI
jgi:hypothetical protein